MTITDQQLKDDCIKHLSATKNLHDLHMALCLYESDVRRELCSRNTVQLFLDFPFLEQISGNMIQKCKRRVFVSQLVDSHMEFNKDEKSIAANTDSSVLSKYGKLSLDFNEKTDKGKYEEIMYILDMHLHYYIGDYYFQEDRHLEIDEEIKIKRSDVFGGACSIVLEGAYSIDHSIPPIQF